MIPQEKIRKRTKELRDKKASPIDGWMDFKELEWLHEQAAKMGTVVEIGAWKGRSTIALLRGCKGIVFVVDPWRNILGPYGEFMQNTAEFTHLVIFKMFSVQAADLFTAPVDMVFIDGNHEYESVRDDIKAWLPKTKRLICGHDYEDPLARGVKRAVDEVFGDVGTVSSIWYKWLT